jgi:basic amino acid/polyamine antiporter, APA family
VAELDRAIGVPGAVLLGLGSILGTGIFVSVGIATGVAGPSVLVAIAIAAAVAICNGLSSAQLAAAFPVSGGTYEYGYRVLARPFGLVAGWMFVLAKSASAATAALGFAAYLGQGRGVALGLVVAVTVVVAGGIQRTSWVNAIIVGATLVGLVAFIVTGVQHVETARFTLELEPRSLLHASALMFVAFAGYGRIATLGEEVRDPQRAIPRAIIIALVVTLVLYTAVIIVGIGTVGASAFAATTAPLEHAARSPAIRTIVAVAAVTAMAGVLLNLVLGVSRVVLAMARRRDLPHALASIDARKSPRTAVLVTGLAIAALAAIGNVKTTWSFSAITVLVYYAITNLAALRLPAAERRFPRVIAALGLVACLALVAFAVGG